jgi:two-component system phosphate regulon response regulator PhoB
MQDSKRGRKWKTATVAVSGASGHYHQDTRPRPAWNAGFIRPVCNRRVLLPDKSGVPVLSSPNCHRVVTQPKLCDDGARDMQPRVKLRILVVDDEPEAVELVEFNLKQAGYAVSTAADGAEALKKARSQTPDLVVLDVMLPEMDGFEICKVLRLDPATAKVPIIMLTAKAAEIDRVLGLELGADDYLTKPFSPRELLLRIKKILSRGEPGEKPRDQMRFGDLLIDVPRHLASWKDRPFELTATEFKLLITLAQRSGRVQSRDALLRDVWEYDSLIDTRTVDTHMRRLREKLGPASKHLDTVRGVGYRFVE